MSATIRGRAVVWSVGTLTFTAGIVTSSNPAFTQSVRMARISEKAEVKDDGGTIRAVVFHGFKKTLSLTVVPCDDAVQIAGAEASADAWMPQPGTKITMTDSKGDVMDGNYNVISATQNRTVDGVLTVDLELEQGDEGVDLTEAVA